MIINGAMKCFSIHGYEKASMADIAKEAGVSKALLFHYFETKKKLFLYLWDLTAEKTRESLVASGVEGDKDFFSAMEKGLKAKMDLARSWPWMAIFAVKAWYEDDPEVSPDITKSTDPYAKVTGETLRQLYPDTDFRDDLDIGVMYKDMYYMSEGYLWHEMQKKAYLKGEKNEVCN